MIIVNPNHRNPSPMAAIEPPIWAAYLASYYGAHSIIDAELEGLTVDETAKRVGNQQAVIVSMGANPSASSTPKAGVSLEIAKRLPNSILAGLHFGNMPDAMQLKNITPAWELIDFSKYRAHNWHCLHDVSTRANYGVVYTSFGCPFNCDYCNIQSLYKGVSYRKPQDVVDEVGYMVSKGIKNLKICDELFALNETHITEVCEGIKDFNLNVWAYARADVITPRLLEVMKDGGINWLAYGFEGASMGKGSPYKAVEMTREAGINTMGNFMFGLPGDTEETMQRTLDMAHDLNCEWVNFYCTMAYPGSKLYEDTNQDDLPSRWEDYGQYSPNAKPLPTEHLTSEQVLEFRDHAFNSYFKREEYLSMIWQKFGKQAVNHIRRMLEWSPRVS